MNSVPSSPALPPLATSANVGTRDGESGRKSARFRFRAAALIVILASAFFLWSAPRQALEFGGDEGMEFGKIQLLLQHPELAKLAWNDQSWFYSQVFAAISRATGFQCVIPRLFTLMVVVGLLFSFFRFMPDDCGWPHLIGAWLFFWCWPEVPWLALAAMLETPAIGLAIIAVAFTPRRHTEWQSWRFVAAGILLAIAVQIKLTALIVLPALAVKMIWLSFRWQSGGVPARKDREGPWWLPLALGSGTFAVAYALIALWSPAWDWKQLWATHSAAAATPQANQFPLRSEYLLQSPGTLVGAVLALVVLWRQRRMRQVAFLVALLVTVCLVFFTHRPWWYYYGLHFAIPLAILAGWGAAELFLNALRYARRVSAKESAFTLETSLILGALVVSLWAGFEFPRGYEATLAVGQTGRIPDNAAVTELKKYQGQAKWGFSQHAILMAQAGYVLPPEIAVLPQKRYWTGNITESTVLEFVQRYQCEVLVLYSGRELPESAGAGTGWSKFVEDNYVEVWSDGKEHIFVTKRWHPAPKQNLNNFLNQLDI